MYEENPSLEEIPPPHHYENAESLKSLTQTFWAKFPEFLAATVDLSHIERINIKQFANTFRQMITFILNAKTPENLLSPVSVLIFHSSYKPAYWPALGLLADRLVRKGYSCALVSNDRLEIRHLDSSGMIAVKRLPHIKGWMNHSFSYFNGVKTAVKSFKAALVLFLLAFRHDGRVYKNLLQNPLAVWHHLMMSSHRFELSNHLFRALQPDLLLLNHERVPMGAEFVMSPLARNYIKVQICNEPPHHVILPFLSDEIWVWNDLAAELVYKVNQCSRALKTEVIGSSELDVALHPPEPPGEPEILLRQQAGAKNILLLLSEYFPGDYYDHHERPLSRMVMSWLAYAARQCPQWHFIFKPRQHPDGQRPPGIEFLDGHANFSISDQETSYRQYLSWDNLRAVAAVSSSGLFAAAGAGKTALRLAITPNRYCWPVIEDVSVAAHSPQELVEVLKRLETNPAYGVLSEDNRRFPFFR